MSLELTDTSSMTQSGSSSKFASSTVGAQPSSRKNAPEPRAEVAADVAAPKVASESVTASSASSLHKSPVEEGRSKSTLLVLDMSLELGTYL